jgi:hypothetical protein
MASTSTLWPWEREPLGIVIRPGAATLRSAAVWAYLWTFDDDTSSPHWHERVPVQRVTPAVPRAG